MSDESELLMPMPEGGMSKKALHFFFLADTSGSMNDSGKIQALNQAVREALPAMRDAADGNPHAELLVRVVKFSDGARWHVETPTPVGQFTWSDLTADGVTDLGKGIRLVADQLKSPPFPKRALPPVLALLSDGEPTDSWEAELAALEALPWGKRAVRIGIGIGDGANMGVLQRFVGTNTELYSSRVLTTNNPQQLAAALKWVSSAVVASVTQSQVRRDPKPGGEPAPVAGPEGVALPPPPPKDDANDPFVF